LIVVAGGLAAATWQDSQRGTSSSPPSANDQPGAQVSAAPPPAAASPAPAPQANLAARPAAPAPAPSPTAPAPTPAPAAAPAPPSAPAAATAHEHAAAGQPAVVAQSTGPAPAANTTAAPVLSSEAEAGRQVYKKCQACHSLEPGKNGVGPSLAGIIGKKAASVANFNYSPAMKASDITWDVAALNKYLLDPQQTIPGNKTAFPGPKAGHRANALAPCPARGPPACLARASTSGRGAGRAGARPAATGAGRAQSAGRELRSRCALYVALGDCRRPHGLHRRRRRDRRPGQSRAVRRRRTGRADHAVEWGRRRA